MLTDTARSSAGRGMALEFEKITQRKAKDVTRQCQKTIVQLQKMFEAWISAMVENFRICAGESKEMQTDFGDVETL